MQTGTGEPRVNGSATPISRLATNRLAPQRTATVAPASKTNGHAADDASQNRLAAKKLAEEKGYDIVVDAPYAPYFKASLEITNDLIAAYDKAYPAAAPPAKK